MSKFEYAKESIRGQRKNQEDTSDFYIQFCSNLTNTDDLTPRKLLAVLADGMGGHVNGAFASRLVCSSFISNYSKHQSLDEPLKLKESTHQANKVVQDKITEDQSLKGMGSTLIGAAFEEDNFYWASVGDSLIYLYRDNQVTQLNQEHSFYQDLIKQVELGEITLEEAQNHPHRNAITSAIMGTNIEHIDIPNAPFKLLPDDWVIIASDGILTISKESIATLISANKQYGPQIVVKELLNQIIIKKKPNQDNTTIMAIQPILARKKKQNIKKKSTLMLSLPRLLKNKFSFTLIYSHPKNYFTSMMNGGAKINDFSYRIVLNEGLTEC